MEPRAESTFPMYWKIVVNGTERNGNVCEREQEGRTILKPPVGVISIEMVGWGRCRSWLCENFQIQVKGKG